MSRDKLGPVQAQRWQIHAGQCRPLPVYARHLLAGHHQQLQPAHLHRVERQGDVRPAQQPQDCVRAHAQTRTHTNTVANSPILPSKVAKFNFSFETNNFQPTLM